ncbi:MAG: SDR family oxidoreductase [Phycisphaerales bacterium]|nr:SDR family oxidoreductase [Phycisphaerales bacterium]
MAHNEERPGAIITGAGSGIGAAIARQLADSYTLVLTSRSPEPLRAIAEETGGTAVAGDITDPNTMVRCCDQSKNLRAVIANAGIMPIAPIATADPAHWRDTIDVNLGGLLNTVHGALAAMPEGGDVVLISSVAGRSAFPGAAVYSASKAAVNMFAEGLRGETAAAMKKGGPPIRVTTVLPGAVETSLTRSIRDPKVRAGTEAYYDSLEHVLRADDVATAVRFALEQPPHVCINELVIRPTGMVR